MYHCHVKKTTWSRADDRQAGFIDLCYDLDANRPPQVGDELSERRWYSGRLTRVIWNDEQQYFSCRVADVVPYANGQYEYDHD